MGKGLLQFIGRCQPERLGGVGHGPSRQSVSCGPGAASRITLNPAASRARGELPDAWVN
jgi:hypothetical protein